jgi:predicted alpha/beta-hydrolase family hydrolase
MRAMATIDTEERAFSVSDAVGRVSAILTRPRDAVGLLVLAHGAGAGMRHHFMEAIAERLAEHGLATFRYQFPYVEQGRKRPDDPRVSQATVRAGVRAARDETGDALPIVAGGKSYGGRMTSEAQAAAPLDGARGIVFLGFPLHAPKKRGTSRADHLTRIAVPMLFLQGTRDHLAPLDEIGPVIERLSRATLRVVDGGDHSFAVLKRSGRDADAVMTELATTIRAFVDRL